MYVRLCPGESSFEKSGIVQRRHILANRSGASRHPSSLGPRRGFIDKFKYIFFCLSWRKTMNEGDGLQRRTSRRFNDFPVRCCEVTLCSYTLSAPLSSQIQTVCHIRGRTLPWISSLNLETVGTEALTMIPRKEDTKDALYGIHVESLFQN